MNQEIVKFEFNGQTVDFEPSKTNVMVNATQMAKIFGKEIKEFNKLDGTKKFIEICLNGDFKSPLSVVNKEDLIVSNPKTGTWMHRILALKFAAWLDPKFEVWVYTTIEQILFGDATQRNKQLTRKAEVQHKREMIESKLKNNSDYCELMKLKAEEMRIVKQINGTDNDIVKQQYQLMFPDK